MKEEELELKIQLKKGVGGRNSLFRKLVFVSKLSSIVVIIICFILLALHLQAKTFGK